MLLVLTGNGKGKTTSAIGQAIRVLGQGGRVFMIQFIKSRSFPAGEDKIIPDNFAGRFVFIKGGLGFVGILSDKLPFAKHQQAAKNALRQGIAAVKSKKYHLVIFDEINVALSLKLVSEKKVLSFLKYIPANIDIMFTGRHAPEKIINRADLVTEMREIRHPYNEGIPGARSREF